MAHNESLILMDKAATMLAQADTIQKAKELKDLALTAKDFAKRRNLGRDAIRHATSYAVQAERKIGEMLAATPRDKGGQPRQATGSKKAPVETPRLVDLGLTKKESARAQKVARLSEKMFDKVLDGDMTINDAVKRQGRLIRTEERLKKKQPTARTKVKYELYRSAIPKRIFTGL
jgi:hypothetical protein